MFLRLTLLLHSDVPSVFVILGVPRHARAGLGDLVRIIGVERERERVPAEVATGPGLCQFCGRTSLAQR